MGKAKQEKWQRARESVLNNKLLANPCRNRRREKPKWCLNCVGKGTLLQENLSTIQLRRDARVTIFRTV